MHSYSNYYYNRLGLAGLVLHTENRRNRGGTFKQTEVAERRKCFFVSKRQLRHELEDAMAQCRVGVAERAHDVACEEAQVHVRDGLGTARACHHQNILSQNIHPGTGSLVLVVQCSVLKLSTLRIYDPVFSTRFLG